MGVVWGLSLPDKANSVSVCACVLTLTFTREQLQGLVLRESLGGMSSGCGGALAFGSPYPGPRALVSGRDVPCATGGRALIFPFLMAESAR